jgi:hypothetical protein
VRVELRSCEMEAMEWSVDRMVSSEVEQKGFVDICQDTTGGTWGGGLHGLLRLEGEGTSAEEIIAWRI